MRVEEVVATRVYSIINDIISLPLTTRYVFVQILCEIDVFIKFIFCKGKHFGKQHRKAHS